MKQFFFYSISVLILDQATKLAVLHHLSVGQTFPLLPGVIHLTYIKNPGAAFGILPQQRLFFILVALVIIGLIIFYARHATHNCLLRIALALQLAGATGNLIDRLLHAGVIDFIDLQIWPVFNVADAAIVLGVGLLILDLLRGRNVKA